MRQLVYDLPTRIFHWLFAGLFVTAFIIAKAIDDDSALYAYHMLSGIVLSSLVLMRVVWGFIGTRHARFQHFALKPVELIQYLKSIVSGEKKKWSGHNPASSWAALIMMFFALGLGLTGYLMTSGGEKEVYEDLHELFANAFLLTAIMHIAGVILHSIRYQDKIAFSMLDGRKQDVEATEVISSTQSFAGIILAVLIATFSVTLINNFNPQNQSLRLFGATLQLGEGEENEGGKEPEKDNDQDENNSVHKQDHDKNDDDEHDDD